MDSKRGGDAGLVTAFKILARWPLGVLHALGALLGWLVYLGSPRYRRVFNANTALVAPRRLARWRLRSQAIGQAGRTIFELPYVWFRPTAVDRVEVRDGHVIEQACAQGKGVMILTPHLGCFEITAQCCARWQPLTVLYRPHRKPAIQAVLEGARQRAGLATAPTSLLGVRLLLKALKRGESIGLLPDQVPGVGEGIWADFFGQAAYTMTLPAKLHQMTGAAMVFVVGERKPWARGWTMHCFAGPAALPDDLRLATAELNICLENLIRSFAGQYLWGYDRYKVARGKSVSLRQNTA
jgi:KDO2-lipid IV(A) lauroyltransferase